jgi:hypothetical protein
MRRSLVITLLLSCVVATTAEAKVPKFKPKTIVPGQSIAGVKVGMTKAKASKVWGKPDRCSADTPSWCQFLAESTMPDGIKVTQPFSGFYVKGGKVVAVGLEYAENAAIDPKLEKIKTSKGIHLGSSMADARSKYGIAPPSGGEAGMSRALYKQGNRCTLFYSPSPPYTKIAAINVGICGGAGGLA